MTTIEIIHGDCLDFDPVEHGRKFQALIVDPPYSEHVHANITSAGTMGGGSRGWHRQELSFGACTPELRAHIAAWAARVQGWALVYSDHESSHLWRAACADAKSEYVRTLLAELEDDTPEGYAGSLPWERWSQPQKSGDRPTQGFEVVSLFWGRAHSRKTWNGPGSLTCLRHKCLRGADKHRSEKPLDQALDLVSWFTNGPGVPWGEHPNITVDGDEARVPVVERTPAAIVDGRAMTAVPSQNPFLPVLDLCVGSGTTAVACSLLGVDCVGFELDPGNEGLAEFADQRAQAALAGKLNKSDRERAERWVLAAIDEAERAPFPKAADGSDVKTWERAQRRLARARVVGDKL